MPPKTDPQLALGAAVRRLRGEVTQETLALRIGKAQGWISSVEAGEVNVTWKNVWRLAEGLGVSVAELAGEAERFRGKKKRPGR